MKPRRKLLIAAKWYWLSLRFLGETLCLPLVWMASICKTILFGLAIIGISVVGLIVYGLSVMIGGTREMLGDDE